VKFFGITVYKDHNSTTIPKDQKLSESQFIVQ